MSRDVNEWHHDATPPVASFAGVEIFASPVAGRYQCCKACVRTGGIDDNSHTTQRSEAQEVHFPSAHPRRVRKYVAPLTTF